MQVGRRLLNLAVHALRRALGRTAIRSVTDGLVLDPSAVQSDVADFEAAITNGALTEAASLYQGPCLEGFRLPAAPEFEHTIEATRTRLAARYAGVLESLAKAQENVGDWRGATEWWLQLVALDRGNGTVVRRLMLAQEAMRDRSGALEQARLHSRHMADEFGAGPDPLVAALAKALARGASTRSDDMAVRSDLRPLAVLPFLTVGFGDSDGGFGEGLSFEIQRWLGTAGVRLADPSGLCRRRSPGLTVREIGAALDVAGVVEGTVRRIGDRLRATAQLVETGHGLNLWSGAFERMAGEPFRLQEELAAEIAQAVEGEWDSGAERRLDLDNRALILRGRFALGRRTVEGFRTAIRYFTTALSRCPGDAEAFSGLAETHAIMGFYDQAPPAEAFGSARRAARQALRIDPRLAGPRATLAYADLYYGWNLRVAEARFRRAIATDPLRAPAHQWYGNLLVAAGRRDESIAAMSRAVALDPQSLIASAALGWALYHAERYEEAVDQCGQTLELDPTFGAAHLWRALALQELNRWDEALQAVQRSVQLLAGCTQARVAHARASAAAGDRQTALTILQEVEGGAGYVPSYEVAKIHLALGDPGRSLQWLERAAAERAHSMVFLRVDPQLAALRDEPRFGALLQQVSM
jgi:TolB-like protein/Tfp pilus assembly protein PilF